MGDIIKGVKLEELTEGSIFEGDELVVGRTEQTMTTVRQTAEEKITRFHYDLNAADSSVHNNGWGELNPSDIPLYQEYQSMLMEAKLWH